MNQLLYRTRRALLRYLVPELVWPRFVVLDGAKIQVRNTPYTFGIKRVLKRGDYEVDERKFLSDILRPGDVVIEMGGSIGIVTAIIAAKVGPSGFVVSLEASDDLATYSRTWLELGNNVKVLVGFGFPVWELRQPIAIQKFEQLGGTMSGRLTFSTAPNGQHGNETAGKPLFDLKTLASYCKRPPTALVIDIEGSESIIAAQPPHFPPSIRNILIELHPGIYPEALADMIVARIEADGFRQTAREGSVYLFTRTDG